MYMGSEIEPSRRVPDYLKLQVAAYALQFPHLTVTSAGQIDRDNILIYFRPQTGNSLIGKTFPYIAEHCFSAPEIIDEKSLEREKMFVKI